MGDEPGRLSGATTGDALASAPPRRLHARHRILVLAAVAGMIFVAAHASGIDRSLTPEHLRALLAGAGVFGVVVFVVVFSVGLLAQLPGLLFIAVAVLAYGRTMGALVALGGAAVAISVSFFVVRRFGGSALAEIENPWLRRVLAELDTRPLRSVIVLRAIFGVAPFLNYALALSSLGFRDYIIGSIIGMAAPITIAAVLLDVAL
ncbi:VTT domain-containing protein [Candidatus Binatia bacterium]|nr:VTT domain-containing protein [Candidatus Binatia bacterium]